MLIVRDPRPFLFPLASRRHRLGSPLAPVSPHHAASARRLHRRCLRASFAKAQRPPRPFQPTGHTAARWTEQDRTTRLRTARNNATRRSITQPASGLAVDALPRARGHSSKRRNFTPVARTGSCGEILRRGPARAPGSCRQRPTAAGIGRLRPSFISLSSPSDIARPTRG